MTLGDIQVAQHRRPRAWASTPLMPITQTTACTADISFFITLAPAGWSPAVTGYAPGRKQTRWSIL